MEPLNWAGQSTLAQSVVPHMVANENSTKRGSSGLFADPLEFRR